MIYWDTSMLVPLYVEQALSGKARVLAARRTRVFTCWITPVECASAFCRLHREGVLNETGLAQALDRLAAHVPLWMEIQGTEALRQHATRLLRLHPLRASDALHLAAAHLSARGRPGDLPMCVADGRLREAAIREGFPVLP